MGNSRNTLSTSKRRRSGESGARRLSNRTTTSSLSRLPSPAVLSRKHRETHGGVKYLALCTLLLIFLATTSSWRKRYLRSKTLSEDPFSTKSVEQHSFGHTKVKSERTRLQSDGSADKLSKARMSTQRVREIADDEDQEYAHVDHKQLNSLPSEHTQSTLAETSAGHGNETSSGNIDESMKSSASMPSTTSGTGTSENSGQVIVHEEHGHEQKKITGQTIDNDKVTPNATSHRQTIREFPDQIEWISREDLKSGTRPACRISKPCILSSGVIAVPSWMKRSENLLHRCGIGGHTFYNVAEPIKGVVHLREIDADFALTIQLKKFQEPTHISSVFLTEHILKASFLFDTFSHYLKIPDGVKIDHCIASTNGTECLPREKLASVHFQPAIFVPKRVEQGKPTLWSRKFVDMFGNAHGFDGSVVHLNVSTTLVRSHDNKIENLSATCFRSMLTADAMFRHLPNASLSTSSFFSRKNGIDRSQRAKVEGGTCSISMGILDLNEGPRGIIGTNDLKSRIQQFVKLAIRSASVHVELIKPGDQGFPLDDQIRKIQELDVFISASGDEMSSLAFLRQSGIAVEILQFGMKPDTHRSLAASLGIRYMSFQAKPETDTFKACIEGQILGMRRRGTLPDGENPPWYKDLVETWDGAAAEFALSGKSEFDILSNRTSIANFDSRHCAKMQGVRVSNEELARSIVLMAKDQCSHK